MPYFQAVDDPSVYSALGLLASMAIRQGQIERGVRLLAARAGAQSWQHRTRTRIDPLSFLHAEDEQSLGHARATLGEEAFRRAWAEGEAMALDQAIGYALHEGSRADGSNAQLD